MRVKRRHRQSLPALFDRLPAQSPGRNAALSSTLLNQSDQAAAQLRRRLYITCLCAMVPISALASWLTFPAGSFLFLVGCAVSLGTGTLLLGLLLRWWSNLVVEWGIFLEGLSLLLTLMLSDLLGLPEAKATAFVNMAQMVYLWAFLALGYRRGLSLSLGFYSFTVLLALWFYLPPLLAGQGLEQTHLGQVWHSHVHYYILSPVYISLMAALATLYHHQAQSRLRVMTDYLYQDPLTGLPNRAAFQRELGRTVKETVGAGASGVLVLLNINDFSRINDELGHTMGDLALRELARRWQQALPSGAHLSRINGDEFALILPGQAAEPWPQLSHLISHLIELARQPMLLGDHHRSLRVRAGFARFPEHGQDARQVNIAADLAQLHARREAVGLVQYTPALSQAAERRRLMLSALAEAGARRELRLVYQPIFTLSSGEVQSVEALLRWNSGLSPNPTPDEFVALAEEAGLIQMLGDWVLTEALHQMHLWQTQGLELPRINVNVSPQELLNPDYAQRVIERLQALQLSPDILELELTERSVLEPEALTQLRTLRTAGVHVVIDDFGTGHSSLARLHALPITGVKLDRRFTKHLGADSGADRLSYTVLSLARSLHLKVVAEGIETPEQLRLLRLLGCPLGQGYIFTKPLPALDLKHFMDRGEGRWCLAAASA